MTLSAHQLSQSRQLKLECLANGIRVSSDARMNFTKGTHPLSLFEYPTTGGMTLAIQGAGLVNAPFDTVFAARARAMLDCKSDKDYVLVWNDEEWPVEVLPLPGYVGKKDRGGGLATEVVMSHVDRIRVSPIQGCAYTCHFCDFNRKAYRCHAADRLMAGLDMALADDVLPARHVLISGGTPAPQDRAWLDRVYEKIIRSCPLPVDVMLAPRPGEPDIVDRLVEWGVDGLAINLELFDPEAAKTYTPQKHLGGRKAFGEFLDRAVALTGGNGRVRSLLLVGLEPVASTLKGVAWLARRGVDPVLSPFRPAPGTPLADHPLPSLDDLSYTFFAAYDIAEQYGVKIGPRCIPCQHNALALPDDSEAFFSYQDRRVCL